MSPKKKAAQKTGRRRMVNPPGRTKHVQPGQTTVRRRLDDMTEQIDIMVPELAARIAALEHLLLEKQLCTREDLVRSREFVRLLEG